MIGGENPRTFRFECGQCGVPATHLDTKGWRGRCGACIAHETAIGHGPDPAHLLVLHRVVAQGEGRELSDAWQPRTERHLRLLRMVLGLAPKMLQALEDDADDPTYQHAWEDAVDATTKESRAPRDPAQAPLPWPEAYRLQNALDASWHLRRALLGLAKARTPKDRKAGTLVVMVAVSDLWALVG